MLLPRYSLRTIFLLALLVALIAVIAGQAVTGAMWAIAITVAVGAVVLNWLVFASFYALVAGFSRVASIKPSGPAGGAYYPAPRPLESQSVATPPSTQEP